VKAGLSSDVLDITEVGPRLVLQAAGVLVEIDQVAGGLHQSLVRLTEGCGVDIVLDSLV
jgi:hypothetical protein